MISNEAKAVLILELRHIAAKLDEEAESTKTVTETKKCPACRGTGMRNGRNLETGEIHLKEDER